MLERMAEIAGNARRRRRVYIPMGPASLSKDPLLKDIRPVTILSLQDLIRILGQSRCEYGRCGMAT